MEGYIRRGDGGFHGKSLLKAQQDGGSLQFEPGFEAGDHGKPENQGVTVEETPLSAAILYLSKYDYLESLDAFAEGLVQVQDMSSSFVGEIATRRKAISASMSAVHPAERAFTSRIN